MKRQRRSSPSDSSDNNDFNHSVAAEEGIAEVPLRLKEAILFLKDVKEVFKDEQVKYDEFVQLMKDSHARRIDVTNILLRVENLFKGNKSLILGFNQFLPKGYEIDIKPSFGMEDGEGALAHLKDEMDKLMDEIKERLKDDVRGWNRFLDALNVEDPAITLIGFGVIFKDQEHILKHFDFFSKSRSTTPTQYDN